MPVALRNAWSLHLCLDQLKGHVMMTMQRSLTVCMFVVAMCWMPSALADSRGCTQQEAQEAEIAVAAIAKSWRQLHQQFERYAHCDDGAIAEGFSESVSLLLAEHWEDIGQLGAISRIDAAFRNFVIRHTDESVPADRLKRIATNSTRRCPRSLSILCRDIEGAASQ
jgi:hypothetical protein